MERKLYSVQYLRGLAALLVVMAHAGAHPLSGPVYVLDRLGELGVTLFFVISGFIMVAITGPGRVAPVDFLRRRAIRIVPLYWTFTTLAAVLALVLPALFKTTIFTWPHYLQSMLFIPHEAPGRGGTSPLLSLGWTLNYEVFFYICFAALAWVSATVRVTALTLGFGALCVLGLVFQPDGGALQFYTNWALLAFCAGAWIGLAQVHGRIAALPEGSIRGGVVLAIAALIYAFGLDRTVGETAGSFLALMVFSVAAVTVGLRGEQWWPKSRWLELLGDSSYASYLTHMFVVGAVVSVVGRLIGFDNPAVYLGTVAVCVVLATVGGVLVHERFEILVLRWLRKRRSADGVATARA